jgi:di/tricarboxylate transporter
MAFGRWLLPDSAKEETAGDEAREYVTAMRVEPGSAAAGKTIEQAGLRHLPGLFLSRIDRAHETITAVSPEEVLRGEDVLVFVGNLESVVDLQKIKGLAPISDGREPGHYRPKMKLIEAVISSSSPLVGRTIRDAEIRTRYGAVVIAVHRLGQRLGGRLGDIVLRSGDNLLLEAEPIFTRRHRNSKAFFLVSELEGAATLRHERAWVSLGILLGLVLIMSFSDMWPLKDLPLIGGMPEVVAALCAACAMIVLRCCTGPQARAGIEWPVLIVIGASFGLGKAMENTGLAAAIANNLTAWAGPYGPWALIGTVYLITLGFTTLISNNAAAALMFPIAVGISQAAGYAFMPFAICIALAASCEFMTPLGYQTNLMVMGPGGYKWKDFMRFGGPLTLLAAAVSIALLPLVFGLHVQTPR